MRERAQFRPSWRPDSRPLTPKDGPETETMDATRATEQSQDSRSHYTKLDNRYGKIGISAVAATSPIGKKLARPRTTATDTAAGRDAG